jgi:hypothetical protein
MGTTRYHPLLAGFTSTGKPWVNQAVKTEISKDAFNRVMRHQRVFMRKITDTKNPLSWTAARKVALKAEHKGMTKKQVARYEGRLGALERKLRGH